MKKTYGLALAMLACASLAQAQQGPGNRPEPPDAQAFAARQIDDLMLLLDLKPAQKPALEAYVKSARTDRGGPPPGGPGGDHSGGRMPAAAPPAFLERLDEMERRLGEGADAAHARFAAARQFYGQLDARQKEKFEALEHLRHGPMGRPPMRLAPMGPHGPGWPGGPPPEPPQD